MGARSRIRGTIAALAAALVAAALPAAALARPDDKPTEIWAPAAGAVIRDASRGITVDFTCPVYHPWSYDNVVTGPTEGYHVMLSTNGKLDDKGLLVPAGQVEVRDATLIDGQSEHCTAAPDDAGEGLVPLEPGTYWVQSWRECATALSCPPAGLEASEPQQFTVQRTICSDTRFALRQARAALKLARADLRRAPTLARRARVSHLADRATALRERLLVAHPCKR